MWDEVAFVVSQQTTPIRSVSWEVNLLGGLKRSFDLFVHAMGKEQNNGGSLRGAVRVQGSLWFWQSCVSMLVWEGGGSCRFPCVVGCVGAKFIPRGESRCVRCTVCYNEGTLLVCRLIGMALLVVDVKVGIVPYFFQGAHGGICCSESGCDVIIVMLNFLVTYIRTEVT